MRYMGILKQVISLVAMLLLGRGVLHAQMHKEDLPVRDTLPAAVKTAVREKEESLPGTFRTDMKSLQGKVLSPVGENDPVKFAMTRPGVSGGAEGFSAFFARGGNLGNNLFTLDGVRIYGFSHLLGLTTSVPSEAVSSMTFCVGGFGGEQGGLTASHIALSTADDPCENLQASASVSNTFLGASIEAPVVKEKASVRLAGRWSPFSLEYKLLKNGFDKAGQMPSLQLDVWDFLGTVSWQVAPKHEMKLTGFGSRDGYGLGFPGTDYALGWENAMGHLAYRYSGTRTLLKADISLNHFTNQMEHAARVQGDATRLLLQSQIQELTCSVRAEHALGDGNWFLSEGVTYQQKRMSPGSAKQSDAAVQVIDNVPFTENISRPVLSSAFVEMNGNLGAVSLMANVRGNYYRNRAERRNDRYEGFAAEFSARARWHIRETIGLEATFDNRVQFDHTLEGTPLGWSLDLMVPVTNQLPPERAKQVYGGVFASLGGHAITLGGYWKKMDNLVYISDAMALFTAAASGWSDLALVGKGCSYGAEFLYEGRKPEIGMDWTVAYTWSRTDRSFPQICGGSPFPARYDRRHVLNANATWKGLTASLSLQSGHWETVAAGQYIGHLSEEDIVVEYYSHPNNWQMPLYFRMDLGYQFVFRSRLNATHPLEQSLTVGVYNLLNRHNPSMLTYDAGTKTWNLVSLFPIMPSLTWRVSW